MHYYLLFINLSQVVKYKFITSADELVYQEMFQVKIADPSEIGSFPPDRLYILILCLKFLLYTLCMGQESEKSESALDIYIENKLNLLLIYCRRLRRYEYFNIISISYHNLI